MTYVPNMIHICLNNLSHWQFVKKPQQKNEHIREVINHSTHTHLLNTIKSILTQTLEKLCKKRVHGKKDFDNLYSWNTLNKTHHCILVWNKNKILHTIYKKHVHKERKETTYEEIGEIVIATSIYININNEYKLCYHNVKTMYLKSKKMERYKKSSLHPS